MSSSDSAIPSTDQNPAPPPADPTQLAAWRWKYHGTILIVAAAVVAMALVMDVGGTTRVTLPVVGRLPAMCVWKSTFAMDCPGCGLTRCFISLAHGNVAAAWNFNPAGLLLFALLLYQIPFRTLQLVRLSQGREDYQHGPWTVQFVIWGIVLSLFAQWTWRTFF